MPRWLRPFCGSESRHKIVYVRETERDIQRDVPESTPPTPPPERVATTIQQVCSACGRFRSPSWSARHPLRLGEAPRASLCKRCANISTSSEDSGRRHRRKSHRRRSRTFTNSFENSRSSEDIRRLRRRLRELSDSFSSDEVGKWRRRHRRRSDSLTYATPDSRATSVSTEGVSIYITNSAGERRPRVRAVSSSSESIHVTRRVSYDPSPRHRRTSSFEDVFESERYLPPRRSLSRARRGSRSSVHFEDEVERARVRPRSDSRSHESYHSGPANGIFVTRSGTGIRRRRPMHFDGVHDSRPEDFFQTQPSDNVWNQEKTQPPRPRQQVRSSASVSGSLKGHASRIPVREDPKCSPPRASSRPDSEDERRDRCSEWTTSKQDFTCIKFVPRDPHHLQSEDKGNSREESFNEYGYEIDSSTPTPPKVTYTFPTTSKRGVTESSPLCFERRSGHRDNQYDPLRPMRPMRHEQSRPSSLRSSNMQRQPPYRHKFPGHETMPDDPARPDHFAYIMSGARITPADIEDENQQHDNCSDRSQCHGPSLSKRAPKTPTPAARQRRIGKEVVRRQAGQSPSSKRQRRNRAGDHVDSDAGGRAWMEHVCRQNAERQGMWRSGTGAAADV